MIYIITISRMALLKLMIATWIVFLVGMAVRK
jgi:hypothetical protein